MRFNYTSVPSPLSVLAAVLMISTPSCKAHLADWDLALFHHLANPSLATQDLGPVGIGLGLAPQPIFIRVALGAGVGAGWALRRQKGGGGDAGRG